MTHEKGDSIISAREAVLASYRKAVLAGWMVRPSPSGAKVNKGVVKFRLARRWVASRAGVLALLLSTLLLLERLWR